MTPEEYLDHTGDLIDSKREGKYDVKSIWYFEKEVAGLDACWDYDEDDEDDDDEDCEHWEDCKDFEDQRGYCDAYTCILFNNYN